MKRNFWVFIYTLLGLLAGTSLSNAYDFKLRGIYYTRLSSTTCEVSAGGMYDAKYSGLITVPESITDETEATPVTLTVVGVGNNAFADSSELTSVILPNTVTSIGSGAFNNCFKLETITIPGDLTAIGAKAFNNCKALTELDIHGPVTSLPDEMCYGCDKLTSISIPQMITSVGASAFYGCLSLKELVFPETLTSIGRYSFGYCQSMEKLSLPDGVSVLPDYSIMWCKELKDFQIPKSVTEIQQFALYKAGKLESLTLPSSLIKIGEMGLADCGGIKEIIFQDSELELTLDPSAFSAVVPQTVYIGRNLNLGFLIGNGNLSSLEIGGKATAVSDNFVRNCASLTTLILGEGIEEIGIGNFSDCASINAIESYNPIAPVLKSSFDAEVYSQATLNVPEGSVETYRGATEWKNFTHISDGLITGVFNPLINHKEQKIFSLSGQEIKGNPAPGIYLVWDGEKITKTILK